MPDIAISISDMLKGLYSFSLLFSFPYSYFFTGINFLNLAGDSWAFIILSRNRKRSESMARERVGYTWSKQKSSLQMIAQSFVRQSSILGRICSIVVVEAGSSQQSASSRFTSGLSKILLNYAMEKFPQGASNCYCDFVSFLNAKRRKAATNDSKRRLSTQFAGSIDICNWTASANRPIGLVDNVIMASSEEEVSIFKNSNPPFFSQCKSVLFTFISCTKLPPFNSILSFVCLSNYPIGTEPHAQHIC